MNWLQLAQEVKRESGLTGGGPSALATATGDDLRIFNWVAWAWRDIDLMHEAWLWRRGAALATTSASMTLPGAAIPPGFARPDFGSWIQSSDVYSPSAYRVTDGKIAERNLTFLEYDTFRRNFIQGTHTAAGLQYWTIAPSGDLMVGPTPDAAHVVRADYIKDHVALSADTSTPAMPARFHPLITWYALREYGGFDAASEVWQRADRNYGSGYSALAQAQLPRMRWRTRPLA